jgi:aerotaxis receptor
MEEDVISQAVANPEYREYTLTHYDGVTRKVLVTDEEVPFPEGRLIVSRTAPDGVITHVNQSFVEMSGYTEDELIGQPHFILRHPDMPAVAFKGLWDTIRQGEKWHGYVKNLRKDGAYYWVYATVIPNVRGGEIVGYTSVRRKPSRTHVNRCIDLYAKLLAEEKNNGHL